MANTRPCGSSKVRARMPQRRTKLTMRLTAIHSYKQAAALSLSDPLPISNLSAVYFEIGDYVSASESCDKALALTEVGEKKQKLCLRKVKASIHMKQYEHALQDLPFLSGGEEKARLRKCIDAAAQSRQTVDTTSTAYTSIVSSLPRYKPQMYVDLETVWLRGGRDRLLTNAQSSNARVLPLGP